MEIQNQAVKSLKGENKESNNLVFFFKETNYTISSNSFLWNTCYKVLFLKLKCVGSYSV